MASKCSLVAFFMIWADMRGWKVPMVHIRCLHWLENRGDFAVLMAFRGFSKSTLLAVYNAWKFWQNPQYRILHQGDSDPTAFKTSRDTKAVLMRHPLTREWFMNGERGDVKFWWVPGALDERNPSIQAAGILSNITSSRADEFQNDDVEVPGNINTAEKREKLRYRLSEQTFIAVPGSKFLYIGTPHTHDSLYAEKIKEGADVLRIPMFEKERRIQPSGDKFHHLGWKPEIVFVGIGAETRVLREDVDYLVRDNGILLNAPNDVIIDCYAGSAWPERFTMGELAKNRRKCRTYNEWDSQYQLHSKPIGDVRLSPDQLIPYDEKPRVVSFNRVPCMFLGDARILSARAYWDCAIGKDGGDVSALSIIFDDDCGNHYWHVCTALTGRYAEFEDSANAKIIGGQVLQCAQILKQNAVPEIIVESNGVGTFVDQLLIRALKEIGYRCGVTAKPAVGAKNNRILAGIEPPLTSGVLWAHVDVMKGPMPKQMRDWDPGTTDQDDDYIDSGAGALLSAPCRIGATSVVALQQTAEWRPNQADHKVKVNY